MFIFKYHVWICMMSVSVYECVLNFLVCMLPIILPTVHIGGILFMYLSVKFIKNFPILNF